MKTILLTLALPLLITAGLAPRAAAQGSYGGSRTYLSGHAHCGCAIHSQRYLAYHNHCGQPVFRTRVLPLRHQCRQQGYHPGRRGCATPGYGYRSSFRSNRHLHSAIPTPPLPRISFSPGRPVHLGFSLR